jgi:hypothetical protein
MKRQDQNDWRGAWSMYVGLLAGPGILIALVVVAFAKAW